MRCYRVAPPRLFLYGALLTLPLLLPYFSLYYGIDFFFSGFAMVPVWAVHFLAVIIHECGHALVLWFFGHSSTLGIEIGFGGGATSVPPQSPLMLGVIYIAFAAAAIWLASKKRKRAALMVALMALAHVIAAATIAHNILALYAGHAAEILTATAGAYACLFLGARPDTRLASRGDAANRAGGIACGLYLIVKNMLQMGEMMFGRQLRFSYSPGAGGYTLSDIDVVAKVIGMGTPAAASVILLLGAGCIALLARAAGRGAE